MSPDSNSQIVVGKKPYSELQTFNLDELPKHTPNDEQKFFVGTIQQTLDAFKNAANVNEATSREYISIFMKTSVKHIQIFTNSSAQLFVKNNLNGSHGYDPVDYLATLQCWLTKPR
jgi:hypothetical protein